MQTSMSKLRETKSDEGLRTRICRAKQVVEHIRCYGIVTVRIKPRTFLLWFILKLLGPKIYEIPMNEKNLSTSNTRKLIDEEMIRGSGVVPEGHQGSSACALKAKYGTKS